MIAIMSRPQSHTLPVIREIAAWNQPPLDAFRATLQSSARMFAKPTGSTIFLTGQRPQAMFFVADGQAILSRIDANGTPSVLQKATSGFLAEASLSSPTYHCDAFCRTACWLIAIPIKELRAAIERDAQVRWAWISMLATEVRRQRSNVERMALKSVRGRLLHFLAMEGEGGKVHLRGTKRELAVDLGITHEALYRTIAALKREGVLTEDRGTLRYLQTEPSSESKPVASGVHRSKSGTSRYAPQ